MKISKHIGIVPTLEQAKQFLAGFYAGETAPASGFVVFYQGKGQGWMRELFTGGYISGCFAVDVVTGAAWISLGGSQASGCKSWEACE